MNKKEDNITKDLLLFLLLTGGVSLLLTNPAFLAPAILIAKYSSKNFDKDKGSNSVNYLKRSGLISISKRNGKTCVSLTKKGKVQAQSFKIESSLLSKKESLRNKKWNGNWYIVAFDIVGGRRIKRDALRGVLKRSGFVLLQKSVWISPVDCRKEIKSVKSFFKIDDEECRVIVSKDIGGDKSLRKHFRLT